MKSLNQITVAGFAMLAVAAGCSKETASVTVDSDTLTEYTNHVADSLVSADEASGSTGGGFTQLESARKAFARLAPEELEPSFWNRILPEAQAAACSGTDFGSCTGSGPSTKTRTFSSCTIGSATFSGSAVVTFSDASCRMGAAASNGATATLVPDLTVTGRRGATLRITATSGGPKLTKVNATTYDFTNAGVTRVFTTAAGSKLFDITASVADADKITLTGTSRSGRVMTGGKMTITNNIAGTSCSLVPSSLTWGSACNCPTSGSLTGTCGDVSVTITFNSTCGSATATLAGSNTDVTLDRCGT